VSKVTQADFSRTNRLLRFFEDEESVIEGIAFCDLPYGLRASAQGRRSAIDPIDPAHK